MKKNIRAKIYLMMNVWAISWDLNKNVSGYESYSSEAIHKNYSNDLSSRSEDGNNNNNAYDYES